MKTTQIIPIKVALEFRLVFALLTPDKMELACSRPKMRNERESLRLLKIRYARERGTFDNIKCLRSDAFSESLPMAEREIISKIIIRVTNVRFFIFTSDVTNP